MNCLLSQPDKKAWLMKKIFVSPNMRNIMKARNKPLRVIAPTKTLSKTQIITFEKPQPRPACVMVNKDQPEELIRLLHEEARLI